MGRFNNYLDLERGIFFHFSRTVNYGSERFSMALSSSEITLSSWGLTLTASSSLFPLSQTHPHHPPFFGRRGCGGQGAACVYSHTKLPALTIMRLNVTSNIGWTQLLLFQVSRRGSKLSQTSEETSLPNKLLHDFVLSLPLENRLSQVFFNSKIHEIKFDGTFKTFNFDI